MEIITQLNDDEMCIELRGRLDAAWSNSVNKAFQDVVHGGCHRIALDLSHVTYLSSSGIRVLVILTKNLKAMGGYFRLIGSSPTVTEVLKLVGFEQLFDTFSKTESIDKSVVNYQINIMSNTVKIAENDYEVYILNENAVQQGWVKNKVSPVLDDGINKAVVIPIHADTWVIGQGVLGSTNINAEYSGELLAVSGLAIALPGNDPAHPDWIQQEAELLPAVALYHGLKVTGKFRYLLRFGEIPETPPIRLSELALAALEICGSDTVSWVVVAETAHLIGAAAQVSAERYPDDFFDFPAIRNHLLFTAEPAYRDHTCLIIGVIARNPNFPLANQLRPLATGSEFFIHAHAGVVPFSPIHKGYIQLSESLEKLMVSQILRGVLHLLNDDREGEGAGESFLRRGALWCAPVDFKG